MVKTTIILDDELYRELVQEALERYGSTRKLSKLINEKLKGKTVKGVRKKERLRVRIGRNLKPEEIERLVEEGWGKMVRWKPL